MKARHLLCCMVAAAIVGWPLAAGAQDVEVRRYAEAGTEAFQLGRYLVAAAAFEEAYRRDPRPALAFSAAQAYRRQYWVDEDPARLVRARELYRQYLEAVPQGGRREHAVTHLQTIDLLLARLAPSQSAEPAAPPAAAPTQLMVVSRTPGAVASIDGGPPAPVPVVRDLSAGHHSVRVSAGGHFEAERDWLAVEGRLVVAPMELRARPALLRVSGAAGLNLWLDGRPAGSTPLTAPLLLAAGRHRLVVTARGHRPDVRILDLSRGDLVTVDPVLVATTQRRIAWTLLAGSGVAFASAGLATALSLSAEQRAASLWERVDAQGVNLSDAELRRYRRDLSRRDDLGTAAAVLGAGALALAVGWALVFWFDFPAPPVDSATP